MSKLIFSKTYRCIAVYWVSHKMLNNLLVAFGLLEIFEPRLISMRSKPIKNLAKRAQNRFSRIKRVNDLKNAFFGINSKPNFMLIHLKNAALWSCISQMHRNDDFWKKKTLFKLFNGLKKHVKRTKNQKIYTIDKIKTV